MEKETSNRVKKKKRKKNYIKDNTNSIILLAIRFDCGDNGTQNGR